MCAVQQQRPVFLAGSVPADDAVAAEDPEVALLGDCLIWFWRLWYVVRLVEVVVQGF